MRANRNTAFKIEDFTDKYKIEYHLARKILNTLIFDGYIKKIKINGAYSRRHFFVYVSDD